MSGLQAAVRSGVRAVCRDILEARRNLHTNRDDPEVYMAGTILNPETGQIDLARAFSTNKNLIKSFFKHPYDKCTRPEQLAGALGFSFEKTTTELSARLPDVDGYEKVSRILNHYRSPDYPFAVELCGAVFRQGTFIDKMVKMGWTSPHRFDTDFTPL
ncbi:hypothetical protein FRC07_012357, partial [Ceratobasidium sp. 392]